MSSKEVGGGFSAVVTLEANGTFAANVASCVGGWIRCSLINDHLVILRAGVACCVMKMGARLRSSVRSTSGAVTPGGIDVVVVGNSPFPSELSAWGGAWGWCTSVDADVDSAVGDSRGAWSSVC